MRERKQEPKTDAELFEDATKRESENLERLRLEFRAGDALALNEAYVWHGGIAAARWVEDGIRARLNAELEKSPRGKNFEREFLRWFTYSWVHNKKLFSQEDAQSLAGAICGCEAGTVYASYKRFRRERNFPHGIQPEPRGGEEVTPADVVGGLDHSILYQRICDWYVGKNESRKSAQKLASKLLTPSF